jgi:hypothetical protein
MRLLPKTGMRVAGGEAGIKKEPTGLRIQLRCHL